MRRITLYYSICLLHHYGYLTDEEANKGCSFALDRDHIYQYHTGRVLIALYRHYDDKCTISLTYGPLEEDTIILTEKEIPELGK